MPPQASESSHLFPAWAWLLTGGILAALAVVPLAVPVSNPDLFWYLSLGRQALAQRAIPRVDTLSWTLGGQAWVNYYWLAELAYFGLYKLAGLRALWLCKIFLLAASGGLAAAALRVSGAGRLAQGVAVLAAGLGVLTNADLRPENFSLLFFSAELLCLELLRSERLKPSAWDAGLGAVLLGALWGNLHPGFVLGAALAGLDLLDEARAWIGRRGADGSKLAALAALLAGLLLGPLLNPWAHRLYEIVVYHGSSMDILGHSIAEWGPPSIRNPFRWPFFIIAAAAPLLALARWRSGRALPAGRLLGLAFFGLSALEHERFVAFFVLLAVAWCLAGLPDPSGSRRRQGGVWGLGLGLPLLASAAFVRFEVRALPHFGRVWSREAFPVGAARFIKEQPELRGLRLYNPWYWGGYFGFVLGPETPVFADGRHTFHPLIEEVARAGASPPATQDFMRRRGIELAVMKNAASLTSGKPPRPAYIAAMPEDAWALVYWDAASLVFVRRDKAPAAWLSSHEYRAFRPRDEAWARQAVDDGILGPADWQAESRRHELETAKYAALSILDVR